MLRCDQVYINEVALWNEEFGYWGQECGLVRTREGGSGEVLAGYSVEAGAGAVLPLNLSAHSAKGNMRAYQALVGRLHASNTDA